MPTVKIRVCDAKRVTVNMQIKELNHPMTRIEVVFVRINAVQLLYSHEFS